MNVDAGLNERGAPPRTSTSPEVTTTSTLPDPVWQLEEQQFQQLIAGMPAWPDPPPEEPQGNHLLDPDEFCCTDSLWDDFFAVPFRLPADPQADWQQLASHT